MAYLLMVTTTDAPGTGNSPADSFSSTPKLEQLSPLRLGIHQAAFISTGILNLLHDTPTQLTTTPTSLEDPGSDPAPVRVRVEVGK